MERWMPDPTEFPAAEQERAQELIRSTEVAAPPALRARLEAQIAAAERDPRRSRRRRVTGAPAGWAPRGLALPGLTAVALVAIAITIAVSGGGGAPPAPSLRAAAAVALRAPTAPAPAPAGGHLEVSLGGISFPYWQATVGWRAVGTRADTLHGRRVITVFYAAAHGERVGYAIVAGSALAVPRAPVIERRGVTFAVLHERGSTVLTWRRNGHTCVLASRTAGPERLIDLATSPA